MHIHTALKYSGILLESETERVLIVCAKNKGYEIDRFIRHIPGDNDNKKTIHICEVNGIMQGWFAPFHRMIVDPSVTDLNAINDWYLQHIKPKMDPGFRLTRLV